MDQRHSPESARTTPPTEPVGSSIATHRRGERMRTYRYQPRAEARM
jgi:hypothetical protein